MQPMRNRFSAFALAQARGRLPLLAGVVVSLLGGSAAPPAQAESGTISTPRTGPITVGPGETLEIVAGGSVSSPDDGVIVQGGTLTMSGGSVDTLLAGVRVESGAYNLSGGSVTGDTVGVVLEGGTLSISGGSVSGDAGGVEVDDGTATLSGGSVSAEFAGLFVGGGTAILSGASVTSNGDGVLVHGGTATLSSGSVLAVGAGVKVDGGTATLSGTAVTAVFSGLHVKSGTATLSGGSLSLAFPFGGAEIWVEPPGTATVSGTCLKRTGDTLTGTLRDGTPIDATVDGPLTLDTQPTLTCPPGKTVVAAPGQCNAAVALAPAQATDGCSTVAGSRSDGQPLTAPFPVGTTMVTWTAIDPAGNRTTCTQTVTVNDAQPPVISNVSASPNQLWPPLMQMVPVTINYSLADNCPGASATLSVTSNEPVTGGLDPTSPDWEVVDAHHVRLRAERRLLGGGRIYTITITATDTFGNKATQAVTVRVPLLPGG